VNSPEPDAWSPPRAALLRRAPRVGLAREHAGDHHARQTAGAVAADGDLGHQLDVMLAEDRGQLHRRVALAADGVDAEAIRVGFRRAHRAQRRGFRLAADTDGVGLPFRADARRRRLAARRLGHRERVLLRHAHHLLRPHHFGLQVRHRHLALERLPLHLRLALHVVAFSGAVQRYDGQLMAAEGGTVFLDEIDDTSAETQIKLLRVLEDRVVSRLGENAWHQVDFRIVAATNRDLRQLVEAGRFGMDLYERLAIVTVQLPPLRARIEDLPALVDHFLSKFAREQDQPRLDGVRADAVRALQAYAWPGNIRELRNVIFETLVYKRAGREIIPSDLPRRILRRGEDDRRGVTVDRAGLAQKIEAGTISLAREVAALERAAIEEALARTGGNAAAAARLLAVGRGTARDPGGSLRAMMRRLRLR
jgi:hypothetical protein